MKFHRIIRNMFLFIGLLLTLCTKHAIGNWWLLGVNSATFQTQMELEPRLYRDKCENLTFLVDRQKQLCSISKNVLKTVSQGATQGINECQRQFSMHRWNCSTFNQEDVFGSLIQINSREKAYVYAISSAGVAHSITRACSSGELVECGCDDRVRQRPTKGKWEWGGCSEDLRFGEYFSKEFVDSKEDRMTEEGLMNLHNNEAGRRALRSRMEIVCKCHGVSGSCSMRVCWRRMKDFKTVGEVLKMKFDGATKVKVVSRKRKKKLKPLRHGMKRPTRRDLVYLESSPDYCKRDVDLGVLGTEGRLCNKTSWGMDGCALLCCGRGYQTMLRTVTEKCNCRFVWCCKVECDMCTRQKEEHYCN